MRGLEIANSGNVLVWLQASVKSIRRRTDNVSFLFLLFAVSFAKTI